MFYLHPRRLILPFQLNQSSFFIHSQVPPILLRHSSTASHSNSAHSHHTPTAGDRITVIILDSHLSLFRTFRSLTPSRFTVTQKRLIMSSDEAYSSFLDQANQDTGASKVSAQSKSASTKAVDTDVPATLQKVEQYYTSEADEPFEPVSLKWSGKNMPSESASFTSP